MKTIFVKPAEVKRKWYIVDAEGKVLGRVAQAVASILRGKNKPEFVPHQEIGDYVIVINADKIQVTGNKETKKHYYYHTGHIGGIKASNFATLIRRKPVRPLELAIKGMLPHTRLGSRMFTQLKVYAGSKHPHAAQQPEKLEI